MDALTEALARYNSGILRAREEYHQHPLAFDEPDGLCQTCQTNRCNNHKARRCSVCASRRNAHRANWHSATPLLWPMTKADAEAKPA